IVHLAFRSREKHLWSDGFSHFRRVGPKAIPDTNAAPRGQDYPSAYFTGSLGLGVLLAQRTADEQRRGSVGSTRSDQSSASTGTSVPSPLFSEQSSSVPTSPSTATTFTDKSRDTSPFPDKSTSHPTGPDHPASTTITNVGILLESVIAETSIATVWSGVMIPEDGGEEDDLVVVPIVVKMVVSLGTLDEEGERDDGDQSELDKNLVRDEGGVYRVLAASGKSAISPRFYGVFRNSIGSVALVLENCGKALKTFKDLTTQQCLALFSKAVEMHSVGILHNDLAPRNVVQDSEGELKILDFHVASLQHRCPGVDKCEELVDFKQALGL
ncbi:hypothetical protein C8R46DRAFT_1055447, partial [Mycena filopes]